MPDERLWSTEALLPRETVESRILTGSPDDLARQYGGAGIEIPPSLGHGALCINKAGVVEER